MTESQSFSKRFGHVPTNRKITIRQGAPDAFRDSLLWLAVNRFLLAPITIRKIVCDVLRVHPNRRNRRQYPDVWDEVEDSVLNCDWFRVYEITEAIYAHLARGDVIPVGGSTPDVGPDNASLFEVEINASFREMGIGWQMIEGLIQTRGDDAFEVTVTAATAALEEAGLPTAESELKEALHALSRRPKPDLPGAVTRATGALECTARQATEDPKRSLGDILKQYSDLFPKPLDVAVDKVWGYSSDQARQVREERKIEWAEAQFVVGLCAVLCTYLTTKLNE